MAQFDVYRANDGTILLDCQSDALGNLKTRLVVPLLPTEDAPEQRLRLNPVFDVAGKSLVMVTQFAATIQSQYLKQRIGNLEAFRFDIVGSWDMLLTGV